MQLSLCWFDGKSQPRSEVTVSCKVVQSTCAGAALVLDNSAQLCWDAQAGELAVSS